MPTVCSPVTSALTVQEATATRAVTTVAVAADDPLFAGHFPGFPIFPGVCLVECAHRSALATVPGDGPLELEAIESVRFLEPTFPGDRLTVDLRWSSTHPLLTCRAEVASARGVVAKIRLRYRVGEQ